MEQTLKNIAQREDSHNDYDYFILPTVISVKEQIDTNSTMLELLEMGVNADKIRLVFNRVDEQDKLERDFEKVIKQADLLNVVIPKIGVEKNEVYESLREFEISMQALLDMNQQELKDKVKQATDDTTKRRIIRLINLQRLAKTAKRNLDAVFADLSL